jgi:hypothetical protein
MRAVARADNLHVPIFLISESLKLLEPSGPAQACADIALYFIIFSTHGHIAYEDFPKFLKLPTLHHRRLSLDALFLFLFIPFKISPLFLDITGIGFYLVALEPPPCLLLLTKTLLPLEVLRPLTVRGKTSMSSGNRLLS